MRTLKRSVVLCCCLILVLAGLTARAGCDLQFTSAEPCRPDGTAGTPQLGEAWADVDGLSEGWKQWLAANQFVEATDSRIAAFVRQSLSSNYPRGL